MGVYGPYEITKEDENEVKRYRLSLLLCAISFSCGLTQWLIFGSNLLWIWLILMSIGIGLSLAWIHIYLKPLHRTLQFLWILGSIGSFFLAIKFHPSEFFEILAIKPGWDFAIGPLFAALTGIGFKEFFCFRRAEAIGITILFPITLLGHFFKIINNPSTFCLLYFSAILLLILAIRKLGTDPSADIGDKSIFEQMKESKNLSAS